MYNHTPDRVYFGTGTQQKEMEIRKGRLAEVAGGSGSGIEGEGPTTNLFH